jgi:hypothetical protein
VVINDVPIAELTEQELIEFLRIPEVSRAKDFGYVIENIKRMHDLPCIHLCRQPLYPVKNILEWIDRQCSRSSEKIR